MSFYILSVAIYHKMTWNLRARLLMDTRWLGLLLLHKQRSIFVILCQFNSYIQEED